MGFTTLVAGHQVSMGTVIVFLRLPSGFFLRKRSVGRRIFSCRPACTRVWVTVGLTLALFALTALLLVAGVDSSISSSLGSKADSVVSADLGGTGTRSSLKGSSPKGSSTGSWPSYIELVSWTALLSCWSSSPVLALAVIDVKSNDTVGTGAMGSRRATLAELLELASLLVAVAAASCTRRRLSSRSLDWLYPLWICLRPTGSALKRIAYPFWS